ncbi:DUF6177 family protein [Streptomyces sp. C10]|uniref:DUF6177 family protein n=1 Tax=Streptomyces sp. C10 TaxID=531941 RepID=UPI003980E197
MGQPAIDVLTDKTALIILERPVAAMTAWPADAVRATAGERALQIVTPRGARLTLPVRTVLSGLPPRWGVQDGEGGYARGRPGELLRPIHSCFMQPRRWLPAEGSDLQVCQLANCLVRLARLYCAGFVARRSASPSPQSGPLAFLR